MTPTDHQYLHSQLSTTNKDGSSGAAPFHISLHSRSTADHPSSSTTTTNPMGGQTPVFFAPSSYIIGGHKPSSGQPLDHHHSTMTLEAMLNPRGPLQLLDFKNAIAGAGGETGGGGPEHQRRMVKRPSRLSYGGASDYDPGPGSAGSAGDSDMRMEYDQMEGGEYEGGVAGDLLKKGSRRLGYDQVKSLEKAFEVENRLEPERKMRLASQLGLQPRQVAVWFQNRRARWKTKQMERDYSLLKSKFEALKADRDELLQERDNLQAELARLKGQPLIKEGNSKQVGEGEQGSPTLASGSLVDGTPPSSERPSMQAMANMLHHLEKNRMAEKEERLEEEPSSEMALHDQKLLENDSLSSTEDSGIQNDGAIEDSATRAGASKSFHDEPDYYAHHWRLPTAPTQILYKPTTIKNEEWPENGENMNSFNNMPIDTWYNW